MPGFAYSEAMRRSGLIWNRATLDRFLGDPLGTVPGTFMTYAGIPDPEERHTLIEWLREATAPELCGPGSSPTEERE